MNEYIPENNLFVLYLLLLVTGGLYIFWWLARVSKIFQEDPVKNILLCIFTGGIWLLYILLKFMQKSEALNGRSMNWLLLVFFPLAPVIMPLIIQHNINEKFYPGRS